MTIEICFKYVSRDFVPHLEALAKLIKVTERFYKNPVEIYFEVASRFKVNSDGQIIPDQPVEVTVLENVANSHRLPSGYYQSQVEGINVRVQQLLVFSHPDDQNLPTIVRIHAGGKSYKFIGTQSVEEPEWRG